MTRTRIRQNEQDRSSEVYNDGKTQLTAESAVNVVNVEDDLNHIRTQLKLLNQTTNWYDPPLALPVDTFMSQTGSPILASTPIDVGGIFDAGSPYDLNVFLNGALLEPSTISSGIITAPYDYQELDASDNLVESGETGRKISVNFNLVSGDVMQFVWNK